MFVADNDTNINFIIFFVKKAKNMSNFPKQN